MIHISDTTHQTSDQKRNMSKRSNPQTYDSFLTSLCSSSVSMDVKEQQCIEIVSMLNYRETERDIMIRPENFSRIVNILVENTSLPYSECSHEQQKYCFMASHLIASTAAGSDTRQHTIINTYPEVIPRLLHIIRTCDGEYTGEVAIGALYKCIARDTSTSRTIVQTENGIETLLQYYDLYHLRIDTEGQQTSFLGWAYALLSASLAYNQPEACASLTPSMLSLIHRTFRDVVDIISDTDFAKHLAVDHVFSVLNYFNCTVPLGCPCPDKQGQEGPDDTESLKWLLKLGCYPSYFPFLLEFSRSPEALGFRLPAESLKRLNFIVVNHFAYVNKLLEKYKPLLQDLDEGYQAMYDMVLRAVSLGPTLLYNYMNTPSATAPPGETVCANPTCLNRGTKKELKKCGKCLSVFYCGATCQKAHWGKHKKKCSKICSKNKP